MERYCSKGQSSQRAVAPMEEEEEEEEAATCFGHRIWLSSGSYKLCRYIQHILFSSHTFIHSVVCLTTDPHLPKRVLQTI